MTGTAIATAICAGFDAILVARCLMQVNELPPRILLESIGWRDLTRVVFFKIKRLEPF